MYKIIDKAVLPNGTKIQLEDWHENNTTNYPELYGYTIAAYPVAKNSSRMGWIKVNDTFRLAIGFNKYTGYTDEKVLKDYETLKNGEKTLADLREHFNNGAKSEFYLGLINEEPEW